jgi:hypothetical protein
MELVLGGKTLTQGSEQTPRFSSLIWGQAGCGKTTLAATAPGKKLWINFDPDGPSSVTGLSTLHAGKDTALSHEIYVHDLSGEHHKITEQFKKDDHLGLGKLLSDETNGIETVVVDSVTRFAQLALENVVHRDIGKGGSWSPSIETPGQTAYGARNILTYRMFTDIFTITKRHNKNVIFITHEAAPHTNDKGETLFITMALGGQLPILGSAQLSEVWHVTDTPQGRKIAVKPCRGFKPMKTRMFTATTAEPEFVWNYDIMKPNTKMEIATWWKDWNDNGGQKISLPK